MVPFLAKGIHRISDISRDTKLNFTQQRQLKAMAEDRLVVEPTLAAQLEPFTGRLGFLDFETVSRAIPVWPAMGPWHHAAAQFSYHELRPDGTYPHAEHLAEGPGEPTGRPWQRLSRGLPVNHGQGSPPRPRLETGMANEGWIEGREVLVGRDQPSTADACGGCDPPVVVAEAQA